VCLSKYFLQFFNLYTYISLQEALAIVLDVGSGMNQGPDGDETYFEQSRTAINMILQRKVCCCCFPYFFWSVL